MKIGNLDDQLGSYLIAAKTDDSYVPIKTQYVKSYYDKDRTNCNGVGVSMQGIVDQLERHGDISICHDLDPRGSYDILKKDEIVELFSYNPKEGGPIVPPKSGWRQALWRLSML
tara:strand:+ start:90185 stop:90526 length:342 start_codon:yes stop_codon:yes gene_type:complete